MTVRSIYWAGIGFVHFMAGMITPHVAELHEVASFGITCVPEIHPAHVVLNIHLFSLYKSYTFGPANPTSAPV